MKKPQRGGKGKGRAGRKKRELRFTEREKKLLKKFSVKVTRQDKAIRRRLLAAKRKELIDRGITDPKAQKRWASRVRLTSTIRHAVENVVRPRYVFDRVKRLYRNKKTGKLVTLGRLKGVMTRERNRRMVEHLADVFQIPLSEANRIWRSARIRALFTSLLVKLQISTGPSKSDALSKSIRRVKRKIRNRAVKILSKPAPAKKAGKGSTPKRKTAARVGSVGGKKKSTSSSRSKRKTGSTRSRRAGTSPGT